MELVEEMIQEPETLINILVNFNLLLCIAEGTSDVESQSERGLHRKWFYPLKSPEFILLETDNCCRGTFLRFLLLNAIWT